MAAPQSTPLPPAPLRSEPRGTFVKKANDFVAAFEPFRQELQAQSDFVDASTVEAKEAALSALASSNFAGKWVDLTGAHNRGIAVAHLGSYWGLLENVTDITQEEPGASAKWQVISGTIAQQLGQNPNVTVSQKAINDALGTSASKNTGTAPDEIPLNSDLGTAATRDVGTAAGNVMEVGAFGWGFTAPVLALTTAAQVSATAEKTRAIRPSEVSLTNAYASSPMLNVASLDTYFQISASYSSKKARVSAGVSGSQTWTAELWHSENTTADGSGFIKTASPIVKLYADKIEANDYKEIEGCTFERVGAGHYIIKGAPRLSRDGWYIETLKDRNNNIYFTLDYEELADGLHIKTYEPDYSAGRATNGVPVDINEGRFVTLRFEEDPSLYPAPKEPEV